MTYADRCTWFVPPFECDVRAVVTAVTRGPGVGLRPLCKAHLDAWLDWADGDALIGPMRPEPIALRWNTAVPHCLVHRWPAVLCEGWDDEHRTLRAAFEAVFFPTAGGRPWN